MKQQLAVRRSQSEARARFGPKPEGWAFPLLRQVAAWGLLLALLGPGGCSKGGDNKWSGGGDKKWSGGSGGGSWSGGSWSGKQGWGSGEHPVWVKRDTLQITVLATGNVQPENQLNIKPPISGRIEKLLIKEGDYVKKGQPLALLSSNERATLLDAARAQGPKVLAHWQKLFQSTPLLSPLSGQIVNLPTVPGQAVFTSDTIMVMSDHLIVNTQVDETDLSQIHLNQTAEITLDAYPDTPMDGVVKRISYQSTMVNNVTTYQVWVWPDKVPPYMRSGMTANVVFNVKEKEDVLVLPTDAVQQDGDRSYVLVPPADPKGKPQTVTVQTGITDGKQIEITSGLKAGDKVLMTGFSAGQLDAPASGGTFMPTGRTNTPKGSRGGRGGKR